MNFELLPANTLTGPRVYSTDFNPRALERGANEVAISRSLKIKLLTKGVVTINGGHLVTPAAFEFLQRNSGLLSDGLLLPAIREDKGDFSAYVADNQLIYDAAGWTPARVEEAMAFLRESVKVVLPWRVEQAQEQYRERLLWGLSSDRSIARQRLLKVEGMSELRLRELVDQLSKVDLSEDSILDRLIAGEPEAARKIISRFAEVAYHQVGTSVVNCETGLDVSELAERRLDYLSDSEVYGDAAILTDVNVFFRCCFETAMQAINEVALPAHVINSLPFDAVGKMRVRLQEQGFQKAYDEVIATFTSRLTTARVDDLESWQPESTVVLVERLAKHFREYFEEELKGYRKAIQEAKKEDAIKAGFATAKSATGMIPGIGEVMSVLDVLGSGLEAARAAGEAFVLLDHNAADEAARAKRDAMIEQALKKLSPKNEAKILTGLREMRAISAEYQKPF